MEFAEREARGVSSTYERLSLAVARDDEVLALLGTLPPAKRQPNLLFGVVRLLGGPVDDPAAFHEFTVRNWPAVEAELRIRATQTNEAGRCALLLPVLAALPQPLALLEVGTSAGLCLYPDRYTYRYNDDMVGSDGPVLECTATGMVPPTGLPAVVWRAGLDLNPLDVTDPADVARRDAGGVPHFRAVPGAAATPDSVHRGGTRPTRPLDRHRGSARTGPRCTAGPAGQGAAQRAFVRRDAAGLDPGTRAGDRLVRVTLVRGGPRTSQPVVHLRLTIGGTGHRRRCDKRL